MNSSAALQGSPHQGFAERTFPLVSHTGGLAIVKPKDYEPGGEVESGSPYSLWKELKQTPSPHSERPLSPGDVLETIENEGPGRLFIAKFIGFEPAQWFVPEVKTGPASTSPTDLSAALESEEALHS